MKPFSNEIQLVVIEYLDAVDITRLEQTCKHFYSLIGHSPSVWRNCLYRQCVKNGVFWPSYKDLSTASEFKEASTRVLRLARNYEDCSKAGRPLSRTSTEIDFPDETDTDPNMKEIRLVPGGRFVVMTSFESWRLSLWDLGPLKDKKPRSSASVLCHHSLTPGEKVSHLEILGTTKIRILLKLEDEMSDSDGRINAFSLIELELLENHEVAFQRLGFLPFQEEFIYKDDPSPSCTLLEDKVILSVNGRETLVWNFIEGTYSGWEITHFLPTAFKVFVNERFAIQASNAGVDIVEIPPPTLVPSSGLSRESFPKATTLLFLPNKHLSRATWPGNLLSDQARQTLWEDLPLVIEVVEYRETDVRAIHRYHFIFDSMNPSRSTLELAETVKVVFSHKETISSSCDGRLANFWRQPKSLVSLFSMSPVVTNPSSRSKTEQTKTELQFVPFSSEEIFQCDDPLGPYDICLTSAKTFATWWKDGSESNEDGIIFSVLHDMV